MTPTLRPFRLERPPRSNVSPLRSSSPIDRLPDTHELHEQLRACQRRLGTGDEATGDFELARHLAHEINNRLAIEQLRSDIDAMTVSASSLCLARR